MAQVIHKTEQPVVLDGYQAVMKPSKFGYSMSAILGSDLIDALEEDRVGLLKWCETRLKNPKRSTLKPEPWEEVSEGQYKVKFSWNDETKPTVVDTEGTVITDEELPLYSGSRVKIAFRQKPYVLKDGVTYGSSLKAVAVQVVALANGGVGVDTGDMSEVDVASLFGTTEGFKAGSPAVTTTETEDNDF